MFVMFESGCGLYFVGLQACHSSSMPLEAGPQIARAKLPPPPAATAPPPPAPPSVPAIHTGLSHIQTCEGTQAHKHTKGCRQTVPAFLFGKNPN